ncbi:uncharacterized protein Dyak_GE28131, isoform C [Drosophila yakuba]|uniref:Uncharacterized protein, isoform C n=1 Tax=Drosophila yakuba TaxID=7245 RepID=A0A0R1EFQ4_DROYA|nr:uncharacterized protein Dyak_GE28131, isoform C [Drosophila yakuba]
MDVRPNGRERNAYELIFAVGRVHWTWTWMLAIMDMPLTLWQHAFIVYLRNLMSHNSTVYTRKSA